MADPASYRPASGSIPDSPGVYRFRDVRGRVVYVGKAKNLRSRLNSYFADLLTLHPRTASMVESAAGVDWVTVETEVEALQLEYSWIKEYDPRFNIRYRDDKSYPYLAVTLDEEYPRVTVMRGKRRPGVRYFGPYAHAWAIRETVDLLLRAFPMRSCSAGVFKRHGQIGRPCLLGYIGKCSAPCVGHVTAEEHRSIALDFCAFMSGQTGAFTKRIEREMRSAAGELDFERAARLRDDLRALERALERNAVVLADATDADVFAIATDELEVGVQVFHVRGGRIRGERGFVVERVEDIDDAELLTRVLVRQYADGEDIPKEILVPVIPADSTALVALLDEQRGSQVDLRIPRRGDKRALQETATRNATQILAAHKTRRASDLSTRGQALEDLRETLRMVEAPLRIECVDVSHLQGSDPVGSLVVFEDGLPRKSEYRRFALRDVANDDVRAIREVVSRRFRRLAAESIPRVDDPTPGIDPMTGRPRKFAYPPQLFVVDGGRAQAEVAAAAMSEAGIVDITVVGLAKRLEEVWLPGESNPVIFARTSEALYLLQRIRDEAHRFAITYQRTKRRPRLVDSLLDSIPGLGVVRKKAILREFGSLARLRAATVGEIAEVRGIGPALAASIAAVLQDEAS